MHWQQSNIGYHFMNRKGNIRIFNETQPVTSECESCNTHQNEYYDFRINVVNINCDIEHLYFGCYIIL